MKKVQMYGKHRKIALYTGTETECENYILSMCEPLSNGRKIYRVIYEVDGKVYDIGSSILYQIVDAADGEVGIDNPVERDGNK